MLLLVRLPVTLQLVVVAAVQVAAVVEQAAAPDEVAAVALRQRLRQGLSRALPMGSLI